jgi:hypothetical protein
MADRIIIIENEECLRKEELLDAIKSALMSARRFIVHCASKAEVLRKIQNDEADAMCVKGTVILETPALSHYAVRFHDRNLGEKVRAMSIKGFNLEQVI